MFYAAYKNYKGEDVSALYDSWDEYHEDTFSPLTEHHCVIDFIVRGKTYMDRKCDLANTACDFQHQCEPGLSYYEIARITEWFTKQARRYGLVREFIENGII